MLCGDLVVDLFFKKWHGRVMLACGEGVCFLREAGKPLVMGDSVTGASGSRISSRLFL